MSFRCKTIVGIAAIELVFFSVLVWLASHYIQNLGEAEMEKRASVTVFLASTALLDSLTSDDRAALEEQVRRIEALDGVTYVALEGYDTLFADVGLDHGGGREPDVDVKSVSDGVFDVQNELRVSDQAIGRLKIGFSVEELYSLTRATQTRLYLIAALELVLVVLCSWMLAHYLTKRLKLLRDASEQLQSGHLSAPVPVSGRDEVAETIRAFNRMSSTLREREQSFRRLNNELMTSNEKLEQRENEVQSLFRAAPDGIAILDGNGRVIFANDQLEKLLGAPAGALTGRPISGFFCHVEGVTLFTPAVSFEMGEKRQSGAVTTIFGRSLSVELKVSEFHSGATSRLILIVRDRTHERQLEQAARLNERLKTSLVDSSLDALVTIDRDGLVTDFSQSAEALFGWRKSDIVGRAMAEYLIPEELRSAHHKGMAHFLRTGAGPLLGKRVETMAMRKGGQCFAVELALTAIWLDSQVFVTAAIRDITDRKQREEELLAAKESAEEASKAKSRFLSQMSHQIRSPMNAVLGALALIREQGRLDERQQHYLELACQSGSTLLNVVNDILDFSKIEAGQVQFAPVLFSPASLLNEVRDSILAKGGKHGVDVVCKTGDSLPPLVVADRTHLSQVLTILLESALKHTDRGDVTVSATSEAVSGNDSGQRLHIVVRDNGTGIPSNLVDAIYSELEQVDALKDSGFGSVGLGLMIARKLVAGMDGTFAVASEEGVGTSFSLEVPYETRTEGSALRAPEAVSLEERRVDRSESVEMKEPMGTRVLLVDDVEANLVIGGELLRNRGYRVDVAHDGGEAVERARDTGYSVILMDIRMPGLNGLEATERIRASGGKNAGTPIIAVTANAEKAEIKRCFDAGMNGFVSKPFNIDYLSHTIQHCLDEVEQREVVMQEPTDSQNEGPEVLSTEVLTQLGKDTSMESLPMMVSVFINEVKKRLEGINRAVELGDEVELREQAHALKSCSGTFGGLRLQAAAKVLEDLASESSGCASNQVVATVRHVADETLVAYSGYRDRFDQPSKTMDRSS